MGKQVAPAHSGSAMGRYLERSMSYAEYVAMIDRLVDEGRTSGPRQSEKLAAFTKLNRQRMRRIEKTVRLSESIFEAARMAGRKRIWLVITEAWCGDAAQSIPVIEAIARETPGVSTRYILRDENPVLIDQFLTNGGRSIPKLICLDAESLEVLGTWGPRPFAAQAYFESMKVAGLEKPVMMEELQRWYNADRHSSIQADFEAFLRSCATDSRVGPARK